ncbi:putative f-box/lrr-repeat protein [Quercus suber]|uniref:F-box/lrr-repeat protein n=1 Tax=Quercus suber TaxID=58331 RepID=A0AAW0JGI5_QUESU
MTSLVLDSSAKKKRMRSFSSFCKALNRSSSAAVSSLSNSGSTLSSLFGGYNSMSNGGKKLKLTDRNVRSATLDAWLPEQLWGMGNHIAIGKQSCPLIMTELQLKISFNSPIVMLWFVLGLRFRALIYARDAKAISSSRVSEEKGSINRPGPGSNGWHAFTENIEHSFERKAVSPPIISNRVTTPESSIPVAVELDDSTTAPKLSIRTSEFLDEIPLFNEDDTVANEDRLSALPNELKLLVLFFLADESYTRDVIQTSALSRGWGNLWSSVPYLHFRDMRRSDLLDDIDNTLRQYLGRKLERFNVHYNFANPHHKPNVDSWNSFAASA